jgi:lysozyme
VNIRLAPLTALIGAAIPCPDRPELAGEESLTVPTYYTYKDQVPLLPGQTLGFTAGKGYYAAGTPTPSQATRETTASPPSVEQPVAIPAAVQPVPVNAAQVARQTTASPQTIEQPVATPIPVQPAPANAAQVAKETTAAPATVERPVVSPASLQPVAANAAQVARQTTAAPATIEPPAPVVLQPIPANVSQIANQTTAYRGDISSTDGYGITYYTYRDDVPLGPGEVVGFKRGRGYYAVEPAHGLPNGTPTSTQPIPAHGAPPLSPSARLAPVQPSARGTPVPRAGETQPAAASVQLHHVQPSAGGTPTPSRAELSSADVLRVPQPRRPAADLNISKRGLAAIATFEGFRSTLYNDMATPGNPNPPNGNATIGYGHLVHSGPLTPAELAHPETITRDHAVKLLELDAAKFVRAVRTEVRVPLTQAEFDAVVSFTYNVGPGRRGLAGSDALMNLNARRYNLVGGDFLHFDRHSVGAQRRHSEERAIFDRGKYPPIPSDLLPEDFFR